MRQAFKWFWKTGILSTFLAGLFALLPIVITLGIMVWFGGFLKDWLGPESFVGQAVSQLGLRFVTDPTVASVLSWGSVLLTIWLLGVLLKSVGKKRIEKAFQAGGGTDPAGQRSLWTGGPGRRYAPAGPNRQVTRLDRRLLCFRRRGRRWLPGAAGLRSRLPFHSMANPARSSTCRARRCQCPALSSSLPPTRSSR